jgi:hypothetical protein
MSTTRGRYCFQQLHIDVARNTTDDFNPFHDPARWRAIRDNPFGSTIVLGFQTEFLVSDLIERRHRVGLGVAVGADHELHFSNYEFRFVGALRPGEHFDVELRKTVDKTASNGGLSTRAVLRRDDNTPVLMGVQSESAAPCVLADADPSNLPDLSQLPDRTMIVDGRFFLKRKFLTTSNGKNFVLAGLGRQQDYFDELADYVSFPPMFTAALSSCALLEKAWQQGYDFHADPVVYTNHRISVDRRLQSALRSNERLHLLVEGPLEETATPHSIPANSLAQRYCVFGVIRDNAILFRALFQLATLHPG